MIISRMVVEIFRPFSDGRECKKEIVSLLLIHLCHDQHIMNFDTYIMNRFINIANRDFNTAITRGFISKKKIHLIIIINIL